MKNLVVVAGQYSVKQSRSKLVSVPAVPRRVAAIVSRASMRQERDRIGWERSAVIRSQCVMVSVVRSVMEKQSSH